MTTKMIFRGLSAAVLAGWLAAAVPAQAALDEAIWQAQINGSLGIQKFDASVQPRLQRAQLNTRAFLRIVLGRDPGPNDRLALNVDMRGGATNMFLSVFNRENRQNFVRVTSGETTTILQDGQRLSFTMTANVSPLLPNTDGGMLRVAGRGRVIQGVPGALRGNVTGWLVDSRPDDLGGTTGVVLRATIRTGNLLRP